MPVKQHCFLSLRSLKLDSKAKLKIRKCAESNEKLYASEIFTSLISCSFAFPLLLQVYKDKCRNTLACPTYQILATFWLPLLLSYSQSQIHADVMCRWETKAKIHKSCPLHCCFPARPGSGFHRQQLRKVMQSFEEHNVSMESSSLRMCRQCLRVLTTLAVPRGIICSQTQHVFSQNKQQSSSMKSKNCV